MFYLVKTGWWLKRLYPSFIWDMPADDNTIYLTFDDGPHETATPFVLDELNKYHAKATFFCIGKNVVQYPHIYQRILDEGHVAGNHTQHHLNGWKTNDKNYIEDTLLAANYIDSHLFRPPYGRITKFQAGLLQKKRSPAGKPFKIIMWSALSGDFDLNTSPEKCLNNIILNAKAGSIVLFHDSTKAWERMSFALPLVLKHFSNKGFQFKSINL